MLTGSMRTVTPPRTPKSPPKPRAPITVQQKIAVLMEAMEGGADRGLELRQRPGLVIGRSAGERAADILLGPFQQPGDLDGGRSLDAREASGRSCARSSRR